MSTLIHVGTLHALLPLVLGMELYAAEIRRTAKQPNVVPIPQQLVVRDGACSFVTQSRIVAGDHALLPLAELIGKDMALLAGIQMEIVQGKARHGDLVLITNPALRGEEYEIEVGDRAVVSGGTPDAIALGSVTLLQSVSRTASGAELPRMFVRDSPALEYRGLGVDVARQPHTLRTLKQAVVLCRWYKIRYLQLHLTDDQSFTFPSTTFPDIRSADVDRQGERHFTLDELRELESFAAVRGVTIVPEIEMPGHGAAMRRGLPQVFGCHKPGRAINAGREEAYQALDTLIGEVCAVFRKSPFVHIGADEVDYGDWGDDPDVKAYMAVRGIANGVELYRHFIVRMNDIVKRHGRKMIVWEGFRKEGTIEIPRDITVMVYECKFNLPQDLVADGYNIINCTWQPLYVTQNRGWTPEYIYAWNPYRWENWWKGSKAYPDGIDLTPTTQMLGAQLFSWEREDGVKAISALRERVAAMSERVWNPVAGRSYADFSERYKEADRRLTTITE